MLLKTFLVTLASIAVAGAQDATEASNNPQGVSYQAILPDLDSTNVRGYLAGVTAQNGTGVMLNINFYGFDLSGPFVYSIDDASVGDSGNCGDATVLNPYGATATCDSSNPASCQLGNLAGIYGNISTTPFQRSLYDAYLSTKPDTEAFFGNRSFSIAYSNGTKITCGDFKLVAGDPTATGSPSTTASPTSTPTTGAAVANAVIGSGAALAGLLALLL